MQTVSTSRLAGLIGESAQVQCYHHQGIDRLGDGLLVSATDADGVVEAVGEFDLDGELATTAATAATASPTSFDMAVGTTESTSNRIAGLLQSQLDYQINLTYLPMILTQLQALTGRTHTPAELDVIGASASAAGNRAAGNPPRNQ